MRTIYIEEVIIKAKAPVKNEESFSFYMPKSSPDIITAEEIEAFQPVFLSDVIKHIPHVEVESDSYGQMKAKIGRMSAGFAVTHYAALVVDDLIISDYDLDMINPMDIEKIGVLRGTQAILLGSDAVGGAIVITTKKGKYDPYKMPRFNIKTVVPLGYQKPAEFYSPRYETKEERETGPPDLRTTIYWNPNVTVSSSGEATFDFYSADAPTDYNVMIEGITVDGLIIQSKNKISRR
jgi:hypothetical protein